MKRSVYGAALTGFGIYPWAQPSVRQRFKRKSEKTPEATLLGPLQGPLIQLGLGFSDAENLTSSHSSPRGSGASASLPCAFERFSEKGGSAGR